MDILNKQGANFISGRKKFHTPLLLPKALRFFSVWLLGVSMGLTACTVTCLPFMGTWVLGHGGCAILGAV